MMMCMPCWTFPGDLARRLLPLLVASLLVACANVSVSAQNQRGTFRGIDSSGAKAGDSRASPLRVMAGAAQSRVEIDTLDWRSKWTLRLLLTEPDTGIMVIRWATAARPTPGTYPVKVVATGVSHADPRFVTATFTAREREGMRTYTIGEFDNRVVVLRAAANGSVAGTFAFLAMRYATDPSIRGAGAWVNRRESGSFQSAPGASQPPPPMTKDQQQHILTRALIGFGITWLGAENGDGNADSTRSSRKARAFLATRWKEALIVDSLATSADDFFLRVHGRIIPVVCIFTSHDFAPRCVAPDDRPRGRTARVRGNTLRPNLSARLNETFARE